MTTPNYRRSAAELARLISSGDATAEEVARSHLKRIDEKNDLTNAFVHVPDDVTDRAVSVDEGTGPASGEQSLRGVPVAIKDLCPVAGMPTASSSVPFADEVAAEDAILVERLRNEGAVVVGKTNACEFGHKGTTDNAVYGPTSTPFDTAYNAGGSSGGAAAAVADCMVPVAQGGDGGGSIRIPAACCGVYGYHPSFGRVPHETRPNAFVDHAPYVQRGPITRTVEDAALALDAMAGQNSRDPASLPDFGETFRSAVERDVADFRVAYSPDMGLFPVRDDVRAAVDDVADALREAGAEVERFDPPIDVDLQTLFGAWKDTWRALYAGIGEGYRSDGVDLLGDHREQLSPSFADLIAEGYELTGRDLARANGIRTTVYDAMRSTFEEFDVLLTATLTRPPVENDSPGTVGPATVGGVKVGRPIGWCLTYPVNLTGHPAASVPAGFVDGRPVGAQLIGGRFADDDVLAASAAVERITQWTDAYPASD